MFHLHLAQDRCTVVGDGDLAIGRNQDLVESLWTQRRAHDVCDRPCGEDVRLSRGSVAGGAGRVLTRKGRKRRVSGRIKCREALFRPCGGADLHGGQALDPLLPSLLAQQDERPAVLILDQLRARCDLRHFRRSVGCREERWHRGGLGLAKEERAEKGAGRERHAMNIRRRGRAECEPTWLQSGGREARPGSEVRFRAWCFWSNPAGPPHAPGPPLRPKFQFDLRNTSIYILGIYTFAALLQLEVVPGVWRYGETLETFMINSFRHFDKENHNDNTD